ncbi:uncharacterized protein FYW61_019695 [Anableps anableps]
MDQSGRRKGEPPSETENQSKAQSKKSEDELEQELCESGSRYFIVDFKSKKPSSTKRSQYSHSHCSPGQLSEMDQPPPAKRVKQTSEVPSGQSVQHHQRDLDSIFMDLKKNIFTFAENELKKIQMVLDKGCAALATALAVNPSHLKELDLSFNYPGVAGMKSLAAILKNPRIQIR